MNPTIFKKHLLVLIILCFSISSCKKDSTVVDPSVTTNPGKQLDIEWPILAKSPWPIFQHDPQHTGRSNTIGPRMGLIAWEYFPQWKDIISSVVIDSDSTIYAPYIFNRGLHELSFSGQVKQIIGDSVMGGNITPILLSDHTILNFDTQRIFRLDNSGKVIWKINADLSSCYSSNIGRTGIFYFVSQNTLNAYDLNGKLQWAVTDPKFSWSNSMVISPDSKTLYVPGGPETGIIAFDLEAQKIKWTFGKNYSDVFAIDSYGNILVSTFVDSINGGRVTLFSLTENGTIRWSREHRNWYSLWANLIFSNLPPPTIDADGNTIYVSDSLYSIDYQGKLRWARQLELRKLSVVGALVCDKEGTIYVSTDISGGFELHAFSKEGNPLFIVSGMKEFSGLAPALGFGRIVIPTGNDNRIYSIK